MALTSVISNRLTDPDGNGLPFGLVTISLVTWGITPFRLDDFSEITPVVQISTDTTGLWSLALERNSNVSIANSYYIAQEIIPSLNPTSMPISGVRTTLFQVGAANQTLSAAAVAQPLGGPISYLTQAAGDARYVQSPGTFSGSVTALGIGLATTSGVANSYSRGDHRHNLTNLGTAAVVATLETTASTTYVDLATVGPSVTVTTGANAIVILTGTISSSVNGSANFMSVAISGATVISASDIYIRDDITGFKTDTTAVLVALNPGANTFTAKYRVAVGTTTASYLNRRILVIPLP